MSIRLLVKALQNALTVGEDPETVETVEQSPVSEHHDSPLTMPQYSRSELTPVKHPDGRMSHYPPAEKWDDWVEWDGQAWPERVARQYTLVPTVCFNCESGCGLLAYVDKKTFDVRKFEGNPVHPGSRGRNCAKGPATHNQTYDPERILYPLKRVGARGSGEFKRISWEVALSEIAEKMRDSRKQRRDGIMYHVGRPGEDGYTNRCIGAWGVDGHNSHTNICSAGARLGYALWGGFDRPSPDHSHSKTILLVSSHLEAGHYFNPHAQRIIEAKMNGARIITMDPRMSNTASKSDVWLPTWPGSEPTVLLSIANYLLQNGLYDRSFVKNWVNWREFISSSGLIDTEINTFEAFEGALKQIYSEFTFERAATEAQVSVEKIEKAAEYVAQAGAALATHTWRSASIGNLGGWQVSRCLFFLNVLTGSVGTEGGTSANSWNKFVPKPFDTPEKNSAWNDLLFPLEWPFSHYEMSFLLPHMLKEGRGDIDVYFTRVYNPLWINPDGFVWLDALKDESKIKCHVALTPTWNESAWYADYVLPMGHAGERHDLLSQETHNGQWVAFRQPVRRVALERAGKPVQFTYEANPGQVWEENEFWTQLSVSMDPDGNLGIRKHFESPYREGEIITVDEYYRWIFENSIPGLPETAEKAGLSPLEYMRKYGVFEVSKEITPPYISPLAPSDFENAVMEEDGRIIKDGKLVGIEIEGTPYRGFPTPSGRLEFFSNTLKTWGWDKKQFTIPWPLESHVHPSNINRDNGEMILLPNFRLPTLIHTRSANAKWLYEISHKNPLWMHPEDASRLHLKQNDLVRVETEIGYFVDRVWITEGIKPGIVAMSHHLGRWRLSDKLGIGKGMSNKVSIDAGTADSHQLRVQTQGQAWESFDPDTSRIWWKEVGVHQNLTHAVHPDPISGAHCWLQKATSVGPAREDDQYGDVWVDTARSMAVYREWRDLTKPADKYSPTGLRRPTWLKRPLTPTQEAFKLP